MTITTNNSVLDYATLTMSEIIDNYINYTPIDVVGSSYSQVAVRITADVYTPYLSGTYFFGTGNPVDYIPPVSNSTLPEEFYNSDKDVFMALNSGKGYVKYPTVTTSQKITADLSSYLANVNFKLFYKKTVAANSRSPININLMSNSLNTSNNTPILVSTMAWNSEVYYEGTAVWTIDQPFNFYDGLVYNVCFNSGTLDLKFQPIASPNVVVTTTNINYPNDIYLKSIEVVKDSSGNNGYVSVSLLNPDIQANTVYHSSNDSGNIIPLNVTMGDVYYPNMNLKFNFIDSKCNEFCYMSDNPLIQVDVGYLASNLNTIAPPASETLNFLPKLIDSRGYMTVNTVGKTSSLTMTPGNCYASYSSTTVPQPSKDIYRTSNYLTLSLTTNIKCITSFNDITSLVPLPRVGSSYSMSSVFGESLLLQVVVGCKNNNVLPSKYDVSNLVVTSIPDAFPSIGGAMRGTFFIGDFKSWLIILSPQQLATLGNSLSIGFTDSTGLPNLISNMDIVAFDQSTNGDYNYSNVIASNATDYLSTDRVTVAITTNPNPYNWCWQKLLPDTSTPTITIGTAPATSSSVLMGSNAINTSATSNILLRNTSNKSYMVTSIVVTNVTTPIALVVAGVKPNLFNDFTVLANGTATPLISTTLVASLAVTTLLNPADAYNFVVTYMPKVKLVANNLTTYATSPSTALAVANSINASRKVKIQLLGYLVGGSTTPVALGDAVTIAGSVY